MDYRIEVPAEWPSIAQLTVFTEETATRLSLTAEQAYVLRLIVEEIATNIIKYGYDDDTRGPIQIICTVDDGQLHITIRDQGQPFDPEECPDPDLSDDLMNRTVGGLGIFLVRELVDHLAYTHDDSSGWNELTVVKGCEEA